MGKRIGDIGESMACEYLLNLGYEIVSRNYMTKEGEIDIIAYYNDILVFIEVKTRRSKKYGYPYEAVTISKQKKIVNTSMKYIVDNELSNVQARYDIIEVYLNNSSKINHIENAFTIN